MTVEMVPHVVHHSLAYQVAQVVLRHADESRDQGSEDHPNSQETEEGHVLVNDCSVYYGADEKGWRQADKGGSHDQEEYETCLGLVRDEVAEHSPDGDRGYGHRRLRGVSTSATAPKTSPIVTFHITRHSP